MRGAQGTALMIMPLRLVGENKSVAGLSDLHFQAILRSGQPRDTHS
jgi:hypothetical protein